MEYAENAKLYLPVENIELLSRNIGHEEGLARQAWAGVHGRRKRHV
jgi:transcription-repair coupling factor (superfamily II helicase)